LISEWQILPGKARDSGEGSIMAPDHNLAASTPNLVAAARRLVPTVITMREEAERLRHLPASLADTLATAGLYSMFMPTSLGGSELSPLTVFEVIEEISKADGSTGWCLMNANVPALFSGWLPTQVARRMFGTPPTLRAAGSLRPQGRAWPVDGGYRVKGQWNFASGLHNATWLYCTSLIMDGDAPRMTPAGTPAMRAMWVPAASATFLDTWLVMGMRGSGSHDFVLDDVFVPAEHTSSPVDPPFEQGPLYRPRAVFTLLPSMFAANALGIARGSIDALIDIASREASTQSTVLLQDRPLVQERLAQAEAIVSAARCYVIDRLTRFWSALCTNEPDPGAAIAQARLATVHAIHEAVRAVDLVFHTAGTNAIYTANPLERQFRDIHVATQHNVAFPVHYLSAGKVLLGQRPSEPGW
jgi:alkylation response protein AidB-like acyl-CoA dehydrogenase